MTGPARPTAHHVAVVVVSWNSAAALPDLVASLPAGMGGTSWQLVVADNASADDSVAVVRALAPDAVVVETGGNRGYAGGINRAVAAADPHTAVLVLNADVRLDPGCVPTLLRALDEPGVGVAVPRLRDRDGVLIESLHREPTVVRAVAEALIGARRAGRHPVLGENITDPARYDVEHDAAWAEGSTQLIAAACWRACAPWDESYFLYSEEADFDLRAGAAGWATRYVPSATAVHLEGDSAGSTVLWPLVCVNRVRLYRRLNGRLRAVPFWGAVLLREATRALLGRDTAQAAVRALVSPRRMRQAPGPDWLRRRAAPATGA